MMHTIGDIILSLTVLLLAVMNRHNSNRIKDLEKSVEMLTITVGTWLTIRTGREEP